MDLNTFMAILSVIAAGCSAGTAVFMYRFNKGQAEKKFKSDLYSTVVQLVGFVNYVQYLYEFHSVWTEVHVRGIAQQIMHVNKDIIDTTQSFYFNDMFSLKVKCKVNGFLECYLGWKAFKPIEYREVFLETKNIYALQKEALEALKCIKEEYKNDPKITGIMNEMLLNHDSLEKQCEESSNRIKYIGDNLIFIFHATPILANLTKTVNTEIFKKEEIYSKIVDICFGIFLNEKMSSKKYKDVVEFLFYSEITRCRFGTEHAMRLANVAGKEMSYKMVYDFFYSIIAKEYTRRMDEANEKQSS
ncbi:hypothetical protein [Megasphaera sp.]|uniref:hypothetical protein n=1 Tax=Megasphaera sp. TaxID=2023260 RepID=UPI00258AF42A|nr:hypothetical protein [Megasphaera sp.]